jgi:L-glutamine:scyllo-inosose aminotransferase/L-glutamine:2-deoxy-scyllo-inosose/3-amino-2,3-dideoxy-scyllo-inosose aminotransferase
MQQSKVLTSGEGGAAITNDAALYQRLEQARADGRVFSREPRVGRLELVEVGALLGQNFCLSEFQSAVLFDRLKHLDQENQQRAEFAKQLALELRPTDPVKLLPVDERATAHTYYNLVLELDIAQFSGNAVDAIARALSLELGVQISPVYRPLNGHPLYNPFTSPRIKGHGEPGVFDPRQFALPEATAARDTLITVPNWVLLGGTSAVADLLNAIRKVRDQSGWLRETNQEVGKEAF